MMIGYLFIRIDSVRPIYDTVDVKMATPIFIDSIGQDDEESERDLEKLSKQYPNATFHIDDIGRFEE